MRNVVKEFLDAKAVETGAALNTIDAYDYDMEQYQNMIFPIPVVQAKREDIEKYLKKLYALEYSSKSIARKISCIREFYKFLQSEKLIDENPTLRIHTPKIGKHLPDFLTDNEINKISEVINNAKDFWIIRMRAMLKLMYSSGLRVSELVSLPKNAINFDKRQVVIYGKGGKERLIPITHETAKDMLFYFEELEKRSNDDKSKWMFPSSQAREGHLTRVAFAKNLKKIAVLAGIDVNKIHPHILRHTFATCLINKGVDLRSIQKMLGHANITTTEIYTHITTQKLAEEVKARHPLMQHKGD